MEPDAMTDAGRRFLNLGCGGMFHPAWVNVDFHDHGGRVLAYDLRLGVPFADSSFDVVYHSHVLEHFTREQGRTFLEECFRVLRPGGLLRVVVPDLENIARTYLECLDAAKSGDPQAGERHQWMIIELIDQMARTKSGGDMAAFWQQEPLPQKEFILSRAGMELENFLQSRPSSPPVKPSGLLPLDDPAFAQSGELHRWMYDELSLKAVLSAVGFADIARCAYDASRVPDIVAHGLDRGPEGKVRKPDSFFMEAVRPKQPQNVTADSPNVAVFSMAERGGAGIAAFRQHRSLLDAGVHSMMYVGEQRTKSKNLYVMPVAGQRAALSPDGRTASLSGIGEVYRKQWSAIAAYGDRPEGLEFFSTLHACATLAAMPLQQDFSVINLHWIANFFSVPDNAAALKGRPVVWTLHDMRPFTGGCHYAGDCRKFEKNCGECPQLGSSEPRDMSFQTWSAQMGVYRTLDLHIVAPTVWLAEEAKRSSLFRRFPVHVIKYSQPLDVFRPLQKKPLRQAMGISPDKLVLAFSAQDLSNTRKGMRYLQEALIELAKSPLRDTLHLLLLGGNPPEFFSQLGIKADATGHMDSEEQMAMFYNMADAVILPSLEDNSPNVISEAAGCGVPTIAFASGGIPEMITHQVTGWLAPTGDVASLVEGVLWVSANRNDPKLSLRCRANALEQWNPAVRAREYADLFRRCGLRPHPAGE